jgi:hypothetical protein
MGGAKRYPSRHHARGASRWVSQALNPSYGLSLKLGLSHQFCAPCKRTAILAALCLRCPGQARTGLWLTRKKARDRICECLVLQGLRPELSAGGTAVFMVVRPRSKVGAVPLAAARARRPALARGIQRFQVEMTAAGGLDSAERAPSKPLRGCCRSRSGPQIRW